MSRYPTHSSVAALALLVLLGCLSLCRVGPPAAAAPALRNPTLAPADGSAPSGRWPLWPEPMVVHRFDPPTTPWGAGHRGVDLAGEAQAAVRSAMTGRVTYAGPLAGRGVVVVDHGDTRTTYEPVSATVDVGKLVEAGDRVGVLEPAGSHCGPVVCLHWGWVRGQVYLDPLLLVGAGPVRLLPLSGSPVREAAAPGPRWRTTAFAERPAAQALGWACW